MESNQDTKIIMCDIGETYWAIQNLHFLLRKGRLANFED